MPPPVLKQVRGELFREFFSLLLSDRNPDRTVNAVSDDEIEVSNNDGERARIQVEAQTGLPSKMTYQSGGVGGSVQEHEALSDCREENGVRGPYALAAT